MKIFRISGDFEQNPQGVKDSGLLWPKKWCSNCGCCEVKRYGKTRNGKQRFRCKLCGQTFVWKGSLSKKNREQHWFRLWIKESYSVRQLCDLSGYSRSKLQRINHYWLERAPCESVKYEQYKYLLFDGTYFHKNGCLVVFMDGLSQKVLLSDYVDKESYLSVMPLLNQLKKQGLKPSNITIDGHRHVIRALKATWPEAQIQRCLYHIQREGLRWLRSYPKTQAGRDLRFILAGLNAVKTLQDKESFLAAYSRWVQWHKEFVKSLPNTSVAFKDLKRTAALINHGIPDMFRYLENPGIDSTTNKLEGFFSRLKSDYRRHRGLSQEHKKSYLRWYCYFHNNN